ncbi:S-layer homology domain-containing protein [Candidatus Peregrinibacteria bacterium]|nr:S-layer homology domain-containing protein [Candidatus Peregrinibacteria bacterium]
MAHQQACSNHSSPSLSQSLPPSPIVSWASPHPILPPNPRIRTPAAHGSPPSLHQRNRREPATRGEVVVTLLHALDIPLHWPKGKLFSDVAIGTAFAAAIETAVQEHIVRGYADADGKPTGTFGPEDPVNRAEMAKIINQVLERLRTEVASSSAPQAP